MRQELDHSEDEEEAVKFRMTDDVEAETTPTPELIIPTTEEFERDVTERLSRDDKHRKLARQKRLYEAHKARVGEPEFIGPDDAHFVLDPSRVGRDLDEQMEARRQEMRVIIASERAEAAALKEATKHIPSTAISPAEDPNNKPDDRSLGLT